MSVAKLAAMRSKDPNTQVGSCIVSSDNRILSVGYNGAPNGFDDNKFPWGREGNKLDTKYMYVCHSELNAILNYRGNNNDFVGGKIYVRYFPCNECAKAIIQAGIKEVIYSYNYDYDNHSDEMKASIRMFEECGVKYRKFNSENRKEICIDLSE
jgi:dCMP deaminase